MPTYEYLCGNCQYQFEKFESITAKPAKKCPECGKHKLKRLIGTGAGIIFKGSGFYETDYRSSEYKNAVKNEKNSASGNGKGEKPEKKAKSKTETAVKSSNSATSDSKKKTSD